MPTLNLALHNYLLSLSVLKGDKTASSLHRPSPIALAEYEHLSRLFQLSVTIEKMIMINNCIVFIQNLNGIH